MMTLVGDGRFEVSQWYRDCLCGTDLIIPFEYPAENHVYHQYTVVLPCHRDLIRKRLTCYGIASAIYYPLPLHRQKALQKVMASGFRSELPVCEQLAEHCLSLPIFPGMTRQQVEQVASALLKTMKA